MRMTETRQQAEADKEGGQDEGQQWRGLGDDDETGTMEGKGHCI